MKAPCGLVHCVIGKSIVASRNGCVLITHDEGENWDILFNLGLTAKQKVLTFSELSRRLFRMGVYRITNVDNSTLAILANRKILIYDIISQAFLPHVTSVRGSRPLFLCRGQNKELFYGEYFSNPERQPVHVYRSNDNLENWEVIHTFFDVRHIHGVFFDRYDNTIWITTGDSDNEAAIWKTHDRFRHIERVVFGSQQTRAVQLLFTKKHVYFGSDTPSEKNCIYRMSKENRQIEKLQSVQSSVFWGCKVQDYLFFSTAVEPSKVNKCKDACIWGSRDGDNWKCIARFCKDVWPMKLFQYGQIFFPSGENNSNYLWFTPFATEKHMTVQRLDVKRIF